MKTIIVTSCCTLAASAFLFGSCMAWNDKPDWIVFILAGFVFIVVACAEHKDWQ